MFLQHLPKILMLNLMHKDLIDYLIVKLLDILKIKITLLLTEQVTMVTYGVDIIDGSIKV